MSKVIVIGIDGMDCKLVEKFQNDMPNFKKIKEESPKIKMKSVFPPDTTPAWASIYTGLSPASHGVINFVNVADKSGGYRPFKVNDKYFQGRTFWDLANSCGKKACVILPCNIYPGWEINGTMICRINKISAQNHPLSAFPKSVLDRYSTSSSELNLFQGFVAKGKLPEFVVNCKMRTKAEFDLGIKILQNEKWDLFFLYFSALDGIQHYFWSYFDETHPNYPGENPYKDVIKEFYILIDELVGKFVNLLDSDVSMIILSDHGHGVRPFRLVNMNEVLRREGLLVKKDVKGKVKNTFYDSKRLKKRLMDFVKQYGVGYFLMSLSQKFPIWKKFLAPSSVIDWSKTLAYVSDLSTVKSYSYGGIRINKDITGVDYKEIVERILNILPRLTDPQTSEKIVKWALRREELYRGPHIDKYPEIILELEEGYGLGWGINGDLFDFGDIHNIQPGAHKLDTPIFFIMNSKGKRCLRSEITLMDIAPTILDLLGVEERPVFDGNSIFEAE
ncbi:MAG: alkaline phosphatase family protein [Candidatus Aminicenantes bacterium]|nr:alkaline phosphatase family protein [Candidatus Aminicenantes bacterium]